MSSSQEAQSTGNDQPESGPDELRRFFRRHAAGVGVITAMSSGVPVGLLVTSLASVSSEPPLISFNVALSSSSWPGLEGAAHIGVHVLALEQRDLADRFARSGADRFAPPTSWWAGPHGVPVVNGSAAWSVARIEERLPIADHVIVVARLLHIGVDVQAEPLVHHDGAYHRAVSQAPEVIPLSGRDRRP
jgi:flavin reductase (DIM6/NTAB) family NADH-FMN oxidoreductase RutF